MKYLLQIILLLPLIGFSQTDSVVAEKLFDEGNYKSAKVIFQNIIEQSPNNLKALEYLGDIEGHAKNWDRAIVYYKKLKELKPNVAAYHYKYGGVAGMIAKDSNKFVALGMISDIRTSFEKAIQLEPKHIEARWALIELNLELPAIVGGSESKAIKYANELLATSPVDGWLAKGRIAEYSKKYSKAEAYYKNAIIVGSSKNSYQKLADLYKNKMNQPEKAKQLMEDYQREKIKKS